MRHLVDFEDLELADDRIREIVSRHTKARQKVMHLRKKLRDLETEAANLGLLDYDRSILGIRPSATPGQNGHSKNTPDDQEDIETQ